MRVQTKMMSPLSHASCCVNLRHSGNAKEGFGAFLVQAMAAKVMSLTASAVAACLSSAPPSLPNLRLAFPIRPPSSSPLRLHTHRRQCSSPFSYPRTRSFTTAAAIAVGDKLPDATLSYLDKEGNVQSIEVSELTKGKKVVLLAVPGAFTPTCSQKHLPGFVEKADEMKGKGVDTVACVSVNDAFVMKAWGESLGVGDKVLLLSDGNGHFTKALGVTLDLSDKPVGLGIRSKRYSLLAEDGVVKVLNLEEGGSFTVSGAENILKVL